MLRKALIVLAAAASVGLLAPGVAQARGGGGGGQEGCEALGDALVFAASLFHHAGGHEILQLLVGAEAEHFLTAARGVAGFEVGVDDIEERFELKRRLPGEHVGQLFSYAIWTPT